ncbi:MAG: SusC/RagA family TonB-linked outer membrane protein [Parabacteroides sp.]|nr:SusC/RagA family TonB-linked outer membrane protein [Parabacteroides sp.]
MINSYLNQAALLKKMITIIFCVLLFPLGSLGQETTVKGKVVSSDNQPLPGVTIVVKGTSAGTISDVDGNYVLPNIPNDAILVFSFVGMHTQEIIVGNQRVINVVLEEEAIGLDEVIAIGYGTVKRSDLTGSVSRIGSDQISKLAATQITESLSGTVAGLYSTQGSTAAGGGSMEIRGPSSISAIASPLVVLDGVVYPGSLKDINSNDIESIDVLKDASSAAIFGSRAAAGVIIVTSKRGRSGKPTINLTTRVGISEPTKNVYPYGMGPNDNPMDYFNMQRDNLWQRSNGNLPYYYYWRPEDLPDNISMSEWLGYVENPHSDPLTEWFNRMNIWPIERENYLAGKTTNFYDLVIGTGLRQDYNVSVSGATENINYYWSLGYQNNEGIVKGDQFSAMRSRINLDLKITDWLKVGTNTQFSYRDEGGVQTNLRELAYMSPYGSMWEDDGSVRWYPNDYSAARNPLLNYYGTDQMLDINSLFSIVYAEFKLPFGITYRVSYQPNISITKEANYYSTNTFTGKTTYTGGYGYRYHTNTFEWMFDNLIKWNGSFGVHDFDVTLLANAEKANSWNSRLYANNFSPNENLTFHALQFGANQSLTSNDTQSTGDALMARLNYTLLDKYLLTASVRRDGYSAFGQLNPRATFPAFAFAWRISEESFYPQNSLMNRLKMRLSWGENGNREIGAYSALAQMGSRRYYTGSAVQTGVYNTTLANPNLRWERTESFNIGLDVGLLNNRIDITVDMYDATTGDLLLNRQLPKITGFESIMSNLGRLGNRGIEATINTVNINRPDFSWNTSLVFSINRNKIKELWGDQGDFKLLNSEQNGELPDFQNKWFPGQALDVVWDYDRLAIWQLDEAEEAAKYLLEPGDYKVADVNGDFALTNFEDKKFIGFTKPRHRWGLTNDFTFFKNLTASIFIRADLGHIRAMPVTNSKDTYDRRNDWNWGHWSPENPDSEFAKIDYPDNLSRYGGGIGIYKPTGFIRVQDINISYNVPDNVLHKLLSIQSMRVSISGRNALTFTNWPGFDPETGATTPLPRSVTFGIDITL